ncbi:MAG TPA: APC family permease [Terriglobia bacterium]|nr:APC family permease [Terriglobia bacterium]
MASTPTEPPGLNQPLSALPKVLVATTAMLSFISFWRAAAIVLNDLASSAYYAGGIAEGAVGKAAPWFILGVMLFSYAVRSIYIESCSMFVRGGVYRVVKEAMGGNLAKFSVSALMFDYILTGPISGVTAGQYLVGFVNELLSYVHLHASLPVNFSSAFFAIVATVYFWWQNTLGVHESSDKALKIMQLTTVMVVLIIGWCGYTLWLHRGAIHLPPWPVPSNLNFDPWTRGVANTPDPLGWLRHSSLPKTIGLIGIFIALGHSVLAMSGEETLAQVYREIEHPKLKNLEKTGFVIFIYSLVFTSMISFFAVMIIPDRVRPQYYSNLISGLARNVVGPYPLRMGLEAFVVVVGVLILAGAVNTAIVGSNGVLNRVSEDGVLADWFRRPHSRFGTSHRIINLVVGLQILTILISRGNVDFLGNLYAFGVVWSFAMKGLAVLVLRYTEPEQQREFRVPGNPKLFGIEMPVGLGLITLVLFSIAVVNIFTKPDATISGVAFTLALFGVFTASERYARRRGITHPEMDEFHLVPGEEITPRSLGVRPGNVLVPIRDYHTLYPLDCVLRWVNPMKRDVVVLHVHLLLRAGSGEHGLAPDQLFASNEQMLFSNALKCAEKSGKTVRLAMVAANDVWDGILRTAQSLESATVVLGSSSKMPASEESRLAGLSWERLPDPKPHLTVEVRSPGGQESIYYLGPHAPHLTPAEIDLLHQIWLRFSTELGPEGELHHHDVVHFALEELRHEMQNGTEPEVLERLRQHLREIEAKRATPCSDPG